MKIAPSLRAPICLVAGLYYLVFGALLFFRPQFFYVRLGPIGPFNEHYTRDVGSFLMPLGIALLFAVREPRRYVSVIALAAAGSALHAVSHIEDGLHPLARAITSDTLLIALALLLLAAVPYPSGGRP